MFPDSDEMISLDRQYSHGKSITCQIPVQANACCRSKGTKWTNQLSTSEKNWAYHRRKITGSEMASIIRDVA